MTTFFTWLFGVALGVLAMSFKVTTLSARLQRAEDALRCTLEALYGQQLLRAPRGNHYRIETHDEEVN